MSNVSEEGYKDLWFVTITEELFIPVRLYYDIYDMDMLRKMLGKLKCVIACEKHYNDFVILVSDEVKNMGLNIPYNKVPKKLQPVKLATGAILPPKTLHCDLESKPRALGMMKFFKEHIPSAIMEITAAAISNEIFVIKKDWLGSTMSVHYDKIFNDGVMYHNVDYINEEIEDMGVKDSEYEAEKFYLSYDSGNSKELLDLLAIRLGLKERMIFERSIKGNSDCKAMDILNEVARGYHRDTNKKVKWN